jgi:alpha-1,3-rhamnosyl/mannosyltransferase
VLTSNRSSLPDGAGAAALSVDPHDVRPRGEGLVRLLEDDAWREPAAARGLLRASAYPWSRCVEATIDAYRETSHER